MEKLKISTNGRHIITESGAPFFYLGDTAWELFHRLNREEAITYLDDRQAKGFTVIQAVALAELAGLTQPNPYGRLPLKINENDQPSPLLPDTDGEYSYWDHVDFIVNEARKRGMYIVMLPTWGDKWNKMWGAGPEVFNKETARIYGTWIARRYRDCENIIWMLGGDRQVQNRRHMEVLCSMGEAIRQVVGDRHLITMHPAGGCSSSTSLHEETWLDFNTIQSGHSRSRYNYEMISKDYALLPAKPVLDAEPGYEDHPESFNYKNGYMDAADVRQFEYMSLFSGACGHTYGHHSIWAMVDHLPYEGFNSAHFCMEWTQGLHQPGSGQMHHAKDLLLAHDFLSSAPHPEWIEEQIGGLLYIPVLIMNGCLMAYTSQGQAIPLKAGVLNGKKVLVKWFDPRTGVYRDAGICDCSVAQRFLPPTAGRGNDWVLVLEEQ